MSVEIRCTCKVARDSDTPLDFVSTAGVVIDSVISCVGELYECRWCKRRVVAAVPEEPGSGSYPITHPGARANVG